MVLKHSCNLIHFTVFLQLTLLKVTQYFFLSGFRMKISKADLFVLNTKCKRVNEYPELHILLHLAVGSLQF